MPRKTLLLILVALCAAVVLPSAGAQAATAPDGAITKLTATTLRVVLPLAANNAGLQRFTDAVSTPGNPLYHHYRSIAWLAKHYGAGAAAERRVTRYLKVHGATQVRVDATGLFVDATLTTGTAEQLFSTQLRRRGSRADAYTAPATAVSVPAALKGTVTGVIGLNTQSVIARPSLERASSGAKNAFTSLSSPITQTDLDEGSGYKNASGSPAGCQSAKNVEGFTPNQYLSAYNYNPLHQAGTLGQGERVALIEVDGFKKSDIDTFGKCFGIHIPKIVAFRTDASVGTSGLAPGGESTLDLEVLSAAAPNLSQIDVYESSADIASALQAITAPLQNSGYKPEVISASLGLCEPQIREAVGLAGLTDSESALEEAAASGISVLAASGDDGSADCVDSTSEDALPLPELAVNFPASSPYVTAVGGTNLTLNANNSIAAQDVWNDDQASPGSAGGGGFSSVFARPSWQATVNPENHRVLPDVAMLADIAPGYVVYCSARPACVSSLPGMNNPWQAVGGTSASTPLLAGGIALVDQELRAHQQQSLGLANPLLYQLGSDPSQVNSVFYDVGTGSNDVGPFIQNGGRLLGCCTSGPGFDAASGWGSVNLSGFASAALAETPALVNVSETLNLHQAPLSARAIYARVSCSGRCQIGAFATVTVTGAKPQKLYSGLYNLTSQGSRVVKIPLSLAERTKLALAIEQKKTVTAQVVGAIVDPAGNIERQTPAQALTITR